ncbi:hypothetical protein BJX99DRAFT_2717 [Aspergillus californicus]
MTASDTVFSDDSSFYGSEEETNHLRNRDTSYDPEVYWATTHCHLLTTIQEAKRQQTRRLKAAKKSKMASSPMDIDTEPESPESPETQIKTESQTQTQRLPRNRLGENESTADFLARLPPSTSKAGRVGAWIYIYTPYLERLVYDEGEFKRKGLEALYAFEIEEASLRAENDRKGGSTIALNRKKAPLQRELEQHIIALARETNCVTGKWMFFITADRADSYWRVIAEATNNGELGVAAKVATDDGEGRTRLIAVYTKNAEDREDIKRVLWRLNELNLVSKGRKPIYYKRDALTYLDIMSKNQYGLKATVFSSADVMSGKI